jgi:TolA-binding protein
MVLFSFILSGCLKTRGEIAEQENKKAYQSQLTQIQRTDADKTARFEEMETNLRKLNGRIETLEAKSNQPIDSKEKEKQTALNVQFERLLEQMKIFEQENTELKDRVATLESSKGAAKIAKSDKKSSLWDKAEELFQNKEWSEALLAFKDYQEKNSKGKNWSIANYKIGVCFQELGKDENASVFFKETIEKFPDSQAARKAKYRMNQMKAKKVD